MKSLRSLLLAALLILSAGCSDDPEPEPYRPDPGTCTGAPTNLASLSGGAGGLAGLAGARVGWDDRPLYGVAVSCTHLVYLTPSDGEDPNAVPQVYVAEFATGETFRTTDPATDPDFGNALPRWSPSLHGFWLAYGEPGAVVLENLELLERTRLTPAPVPNGRVDIWFPYVAWEAASDEGSDVVLSNMWTGETGPVNGSSATSVEPAVDGDWLLFTTFADDSNGRQGGLTGVPAVLKLKLLETEEKGTLAYAIDLASPARSPDVYDGKAVFVTREAGTGTAMLRVVRLDDDEVLGETTQDVTQFDQTYPEIGAGVVVFYNATEGTVHRWSWEDDTVSTIGRVGDLPVVGAPRPSAGEYVLAFPDDGGDDRSVSARVFSGGALSRLSGAGKSN